MEEKMIMEATSVPDKMPTFNDVYFTSINNRDELHRIRIKAEEILARFNGDEVQKEVEGVKRSDAISMPISVRLHSIQMDINSEAVEIEMILNTINNFIE